MEMCYVMIDSDINEYAKEQSEVIRQWIDAFQ